MTFELHRLLQKYSWGIKQGLGIVTWNTEDTVVIGLVCVFLEVFLTALYFRVTYCPYLQSLCSIHACALCSWEALGNIRHFCEWGTSCEGGGSNLLCGVYYASFLTFFPAWGEHSVNQGQLCSMEDVRQVCGRRPFLHQSTVDLSQEWTPPR